MLEHVYIGETYGEGTSAPWRATADLRVITEERKDSLVAQRHVDETVVRKRAHGIHSSALLPTAHSGSRHEQTRVLAPQGTGLPLAAGLVPEGLPLGREVAVSGRDAEEEGVVLLEGFWVAERGDLAGFGRGVHLGQDVFGERLFDAVEVAAAAGGFDALGLGLCEGLDVAVHRVLEGIVLVDTFEAMNPRGLNGSTWFVWIEWDCRVH